MTHSPNNTLTAEQALAAAAVSRRIYIEASPGAGKTTVAAEQFGIARFTADSRRRAVVALSFTRAATAELRQRILTRWGPAAVEWPHRVITLDTLMCDLLTFLLRRKLLYWPGGHVSLTVHDTWKARLTHHWGRQDPFVQVQGSTVAVVNRWSPAGPNRVDKDSLEAAIGAGECSHADVRSILEQALLRPHIAEAVATYLANSTHTMIIDEIFDANPLDLQLVDIACAAGIRVSIIGDPWQALYQFRGARPEDVPNLVQRHDFQRHSLTKSFRFDAPEVQALSRNLRNGHAVVLSRSTTNDCDIVLATTWKGLWNCGPDVLPLSFGTPNNYRYSATLLFLDHVTTSVLGQHAIFIREALTNLGIIDPQALDELHEPFAQIASLLRTTEAAKVWPHLVEAIGLISPRKFPQQHHTHVKRLEHIRSRLLAQTPRFVPGITVHQAKGREWNHVAIHLTADETKILETGLHYGDEAHRKLYVALTRGRCTTTRCFI